MPHRLKSAIDVVTILPHLNGTLNKFINVGIGNFYRLGKSDAAFTNVKTFEETSIGVDLCRISNI